MAVTREPCIITAAITGSVPKKADNPAVPISVPEQVEATCEAYEAGARVVHVHMRNADETPSSDPAKFQAFLEGCRKHCPGMIVQFSTGARGRAHHERAGMLHLRPDMASLATGSVNFPNMIYENPPDLIDGMAKSMLDFGIKPEVEVFDLAMLYNAAKMAEDGRLARPVHVQFVLGIKNALPAERRVLDFMVEELRRIMPDATWVAAGIGRHQLEVNRWSLELGGHCRTGLEDNIRFDKSRLAKSNAELVARVADLCAEFERPIATPEEARRLMTMPPLRQAAE